jgi:hypothetical protein
VKLRALVLSMIAAGLVTGLAAADNFDPHDFDVQMTNAPKIGIKGAGDLVMTGVTASGTVKEKAGNHSGTMSETCDIELHTRLDGQNFSANGASRCSWFMDFGSGSTLAGTLSGANHVAMSPDGGTMTGTMTVTVVAGTGDFAGRVGSGTFTQNQTLPAPPKPPAPPGGGNGCVLPPGADPPKPGDPPPPGCTGGTPPATPGPPAPGAPQPGNPGCTLPPGTPPPAPGTPPPPGCTPTPGGTPPGGTPGNPSPPAGCPTPVPGTTPPPCIGPAVPVDPPPTTPTCPPPGATPPPGFVPPANCPKAQAIVRSLMSVVAGGSKMNLKLRKGEAIAKIAAPGPTLTAKSDGGLRVVAAPGSTCSAVASGPSTVKLGSAKDTNHDGLVVVVKKLYPKLSAGQWSIVATCTAGGHTVTAKSTLTVS